MKEVSIKNILDEVYFGKVDDAIQKLEQYGFYDVLNKKVITIYKKLESKELLNIEIVATSFLQTINTKLNSVEDDTDKYFLKYIISEVSNYLIKKYFSIEEVTYENLERLEGALQSISEVEEYDYRDLESRLNLKKTISFLKLKTSSKPIIVHYEWCRDKESLNTLAYDLKSMEVIRSVGDFKRLFSSSPISVKIDDTHKEFVFILFDLLHEQRLIKAKGRKGHFTPLVKNTVDYENNILFNKRPNQIKYTIQKNKEKYWVLRAKAEKRIASIGS